MKKIDFNAMDELERSKYECDSEEELVAIPCKTPECLEFEAYLNYIVDGDFYRCPYCGREIDNNLDEIIAYLETMVD